MGNLSKNCRGEPLRAGARAGGFTLLELMVALAVGAIAVATAYTLGAASSEQFRSQQRISNLQTALRNAMNQVKRDIERAGYHATPNSSLGGETCLTTVTVTAMGGVVKPIALQDDADTDLVFVVSGDDYGGRLQSDRLTMIGNYSSRDEYTIAGLTTETRVVLESGNQAFRRSFTSWWATNPQVLGDAVSDMFVTNRLLRLQNQEGYKFFVRITSSGVNAGVAEVEFANDNLEVGSSCVGGIMTGAKAAPLSVIRYRLFEPSDAATDEAPTVARNEDVAGKNIQLVREELNPVSGAVVGSRSALLDYVISFDVDFVIDDRSDGTNTASLVLLDDGATAPNGHSVDANPERVRSAIVTLSARTPEMDPRFPWLADPLSPSGEIRKYRFSTRAGAARVRTLRAEIPVGSIAYEGL